MPKHNKRLTKCSAILHLNKTKQKHVSLASAVQNDSWGCSYLVISSESSKAMYNHTFPAFIWISHPETQNNETTGQTINLVPRVLYPGNEVDRRSPLMWKTKSKRFCFWNWGSYVRKIRFLLRSLNYSFLELQVADYFSIYFAKDIDRTVTSDNLKVCSCDHVQVVGLMWGS